VLLVSLSMLTALGSTKTELDELKLRAIGPSEEVQGFYLLDGHECQTQDALVFKLSEFHVGLTGVVEEPCEVPSLCPIHTDNSTITLALHDIGTLSGESVSPRAVITGPRVPANGSFW